MKRTTFNYTEQVANDLAQKINLETDIVCNPSELKIDGKKHRLGNRYHIEYCGYGNSGIGWFRDYKQDIYKTVKVSRSFRKVGGKS